MVIKTSSFGQSLLILSYNDRFCQETLSFLRFSRYISAENNSTNWLLWEMAIKKLALMAPHEVDNGDNITEQSFKSCYTEDT